MAACDVVIVNYNAGKHIERCVATVLASAGDADVGVIVVDNDSADDSGEAVAARHPEVRLIANPDNRGFGRAANQGIEAGSAPYVFVLNPDSEVRAGTFSELVDAAESNPDVAAFGVLTTEP